DALALVASVEQPLPAGPVLENPATARDPIDPALAGELDRASHVRVPFADPEVERPGPLVTETGEALRLGLVAEWLEPGIAPERLEPFVAIEQRDVAITRGNGPIEVLERAVAIALLRSSDREAGEGERRLAGRRFPDELLEVRHGLVRAG